jgi:hypothetical protein
MRAPLRLASGMTIDLDYSPSLSWDRRLSGFCVKSVDSFEPHRRVRKTFHNACFLGEICVKRISLIQDELLLVSRRPVGWRCLLSFAQRLVEYRLASQSARNFRNGVDRQNRPQLRSQSEPSFLEEEGALTGCSFETTLSGNDAPDSSKKCV